MDKFAWPGAVVVIVLAILLLYRPQIRSLLDRATSVKLPGGVQADLGSVPQNQVRLAEEAAAPKLPVQERLGTPPISDLHQPIETEVMSRISESVPDSALHFRWAVRLFAMVLVEKNHETNYRIMFGSQIAALKHICQSGGSRSLTALRGIYDETAEKYSEEYKTFEFSSWLGYLAQCQYTTQDGQQSEPAVAITPLGRDFLGWMAGKGVFEGKGL